MNNQAINWAVLVLVAILLIVGAIQGSHGRMFAVAFAPANLMYNGLTADDIENPDRIEIQKIEQAQLQGLARMFGG